ncbi:MAG: TRAP transporter small permease [Peptococcaceae bacterium]|jgi:TRAP-type C4-dicarboxylate transport system permease small subunit|nr:TRAP transporter small permease [Peptococcaceae bacterium]MDH7524995.1 TRAP transporter small permease [Peptococcaceae bacterium]
MAKTVSSLLVKTSDLLDRMITALVFFIITGMVTATTLQVVFRVFFTALAWSEEISRYFLVWGTFFAATMAYKRGNHIAINFFIEALPQKIRFYFSLLIYVLSLLFFAVISYYSLVMIKLQVFQISPALGIPMQFVYMSIPVSLTVMALHALGGMAQMLNNKGKKGVAA